MFCKCLNVIDGRFYTVRAAVESDLLGLFDQAGR